MSNKIRWKMMLEVERILLSNGAYIYGGFVRDKIIHDHNAIEFYKKIGEAVNKEQSYLDPEYLPEYKDRRILPYDIDCFMTNNNLKELKTALISKQYTVTIKKNGKAKFYLNQTQNIDLYHTKILIKPKIHNFFTDIINVDSLVLDIDVLHGDKPITKIYRELSNNFDFECNSLIITPDNEYKLAYFIARSLDPKSKLDKITKIIDDIIHKRAIALDIPPMIRTYKMFIKEFDIITSNYQLTKIVNKYDGHCIICHGECDVNKYCIKDSNCDAHFHLTCYLSMVSHQSFTQECPMCKKNINIDVITLDTLEIIEKNI